MPDMPIDPNTFAEAMRRVASGRSVRSVFRDDDMPGLSTFYEMISTDAVAAEHYARATEMRADVMADEIIEIADDGTNDYMAANDPENPGYKERGELVRRSALRVDARKWILARMAPRKYGDRQAVDVSGGLVINIGKDDADL